MHTSTYHVIPAKAGIYSDLIKKFNWRRYCVDKLVYFETHDDIKMAILREKQIKKWNRDWKINLIEQTNPGWIDLYYELNG